MPDNRGRGINFHKVLEEMIDPKSKHWASAKERFGTLLVNEARTQLHNSFQLYVSIKNKRGEANGVSISSPVSEQ